MLSRKALILFIAAIATTLLLTCPVFAISLPTAGTGVIKETIDASGYTYLQLETPSGTGWVAIPQTQVDVGEKVTYLDGMTMTNFHSNTLNRTFDSIIFSSGLEGKEPTPPEVEEQQAATTSSFADAVKSEREQKAPVQEQQQISGGSLAATVPFVETEVQKASGDASFTVEEIFAKAKDLDGTQVLVRGKIVKFNPNIMGRNWVHLQDGTGNPMQNTHDLVVTTESAMEVGQTATFSGTVAADKDFGYGYKYKVLIEAATVMQ